MRSILLVAFVVTPLEALAADSYLCIAAHTAGFAFDGTRDEGASGSGASGSQGASGSGLALTHSPRPGLGVRSCITAFPPVKLTLWRSGRMVKNQEATTNG